MFSKTKSSPSSAIVSDQNASSKKGMPSLIAADLNVLGNIVCEGMIDIDGSIEGNVRAKHLTIRKNGRVKGDVVAEIVHVYGEVHGLIRARMVQLFSSCHVEGIIMYESLSIEDGAFVDGKFKRSDRMDVNEHREEEGILEIPSSSGLKVVENLRLIN